MRTQPWPSRTSHPSPGRTSGGHLSCPAQDHGAAANEGRGRNNGGHTSALAQNAEHALHTEAVRKRQCWDGFSLIPTNQKMRRRLPQAHKP